jgi:hypothetical protein
MPRFFPYHPRDTDAMAAVCQVIDIARIVEGRYKVVADSLTYYDAIKLADELNLKPIES